MDIQIRPARSTDIPFIYATCLKSLRHDSVLGKMVRASVFFKEYRNVLDRILFESEVLVACNPGEPSVIFGYMIFQRPNIIHYAFTKEAFRRFHIQTRLLNVAGLNLPITTTHKTKTGSFINYDYNPFLLFKKSEGES